jgi:hypothetical protein
MLERKHASRGVPRIAQQKITCAASRNQASFIVRPLMQINQR